ncbi:1073_t:CDS:2 [Acaulospora morrowiae]|uniref:1073_t:CDS:1 n=1 Tax=Acaulospora morrowiae TaxID=94023 RepID=A0A9N9BMM1_9GLOM|nr:1073_t:CDS:2 [Acaulospora morrowiae]
MTKITHCIFDMDGLLLDTEQIYSDVISEILERYGKKYTWELKSRSMGLRQDDSATFLIENTGIDMTAEELIRERNEKHIQRFPFARPMPGAMRLVKHLKAHNIPMVVATSSHRNSFMIKASNNQDLFGMFDDVTCGNDPGVKNGKPAPDLFLVACEKIGNPPVEQCLVFEDAPNGVRAAKNAGMHVVWVPDPNVAALHPGDNGADDVISSLENFDPAKFGLPPFSN